MKKKVLSCIIVLSIVFISSKSFSQVGIDTTNPLSTLDINGNVSVKTFIIIGSANSTKISNGFYLFLNP